MDTLEADQAATFDILKGLLETSKLSQGYTDRDGKKGYRFDGTDPGKYDAFITSYMDRITDSMSTKQKLNILYGIIEKRCTGNIYPPPQSYERPRLETGSHMGGS